MSLQKPAPMFVQTILFENKCTCYGEAVNYYENPCEYKGQCYKSGTKIIDGGCDSLYCHMGYLSSGRCLGGKVNKKVLKAIPGNIKKPKDNCVHDSRFGGYSFKVEF